MIDIKFLQEAITLSQTGKISEAESLYQKLLLDFPDDFNLLSAMGLFYVSLRDFDRALNYLKQAFEIKETLGTASALGFAEYERKDFKKAIFYLEKALDYGDSSEVYFRLIDCSFIIKDFPKAIKYSDIAYEKYPENPRAITYKVQSLTQAGELFAAEELCVDTLRKNQKIPSLWFRLGFLKELIYSDDVLACECYKKALEFGAKEAYYNIAVSYLKQANYQKAEEHFDKALEYSPRDTSVITSLGMCKLSQKKFKEGYELFFQREKHDIEYKLKNAWIKDREWEDEVLVLCDQGFGDHMQFIRYLPFLKEKVKKVYVATRPILASIFKSSYPEVEFIAFDDIDIYSDKQYVRITDLAYALDMDFDNIPFSEGYLVSDSDKIESNKLKVGLCWEAGSAAIRTMINRTINVKLLEPFMDIDNVQIYSFQVQDTLKGNEIYSNKMINLAKDFKDFSDTAKAMKSMDLIISVDTSVAHLAGALGVKTFLMLPYATDWRWFDDSKTTPWYNSVEIFKQDDPISWEKPIEDIICRLKEYSL